MEAIEDNHGGSGGAVSKYNVLEDERGDTPRSEGDDEDEEGSETSTAKVRRILVIGATGLQGGAVVQHLLQEEDVTVIGLSRHGSHSDKAKELMALGVTMIKGDMDDPLSLDRAMAVASGAMPGYHPTPGALFGVFSVQNYWRQPVAPDGRREAWQGKNVVDAAKRAKVQLFVYSSIGSATQHKGPFHVPGGQHATGIPHFESKFEVELHLKESGMRYTILRPAPFFMDNFWRPETPWAHPGESVCMPFKAKTRQQMVLAEDLGAMACKAFLRGGEGDTAYKDGTPGSWVGLELEVAGDEISGEQIAAVFSIVSGRPIGYSRGPLMLALRAASSEGWMQTKFLEEVGNCADVGECRKRLPKLHSLEMALRKHGWVNKAPVTFRQPLLSCHAPDMWLLSLACPCCVVGWVAKHVGDSAFFCTVAAAAALPCVLMRERGRLRDKLQLRGSCLADCCAAHVCPLCVLVQAGDELRHRAKQALQQQHKLAAAAPKPKPMLMMRDRTAP